MSDVIRKHISAFPQHSSAHISIGLMSGQVSRKEVTHLGIVWLANAASPVYIRWYISVHAMSIHLQCFTFYLVWTQRYYIGLVDSSNLKGHVITAIHYALVWFVAEQCDYNERLGLMLDCCRGACQFSTRLEQSYPQSRRFGTSRDLASARLVNRGPRNWSIESLYQ